MNNTDPTKNLGVNTFDWCWNPDLPTAVMCDHLRLVLEPRSSHCSHVRSPEAANRANIKQHIFGIRKSKYTEYIMCPSHGIAVILPMLAYNTKQSISMMCNWYDIFQLQDIYIRWPLDTKKNVKGIHLCYTVSCDFRNKAEQLLNFKFQWSIRWSLSLLIWKRMKSLFIFQKRYNIQIFCSCI